MKRIALLVTALLVIGCAPIPHKAAVLHELSIQRADSSASLMDLRITHEYADSTCADPDREVTLVPGQTLEVPGKREWQLFMIMDPLSGFRVCSKNGKGEWQPSLEFFHMGYSTGTIKVVCRNALDFNAESETGASYCYTPKRSPPVNR